MSMRILLVKSGEATPALRDNYADYDKWFQLALADERIDWKVVRPYAGEPLPDRFEADAVIISGSRLSLVEPEGWMRAAAEWTRKQLDRGTPLLGVCFGHQLLGWTLGVPVVRNPRGRELGTQPIRLTEAGLADPLFEGLGPELKVQTTHDDVIAAPPPGAVVLAGNENTPLQAMAVGDRARSVQFHPELSVEGMRVVVRKQLADADEETLRRALDAVTPTPAGASILGNFLRNIAGARGPSASMRA